MERPLTVGQLAGATGVSAKTIRYYEHVGVLPLAHRSSAGYRQYSRRGAYRGLHPAQRRQGVTPGG
jgi:DNA-binding transcriptional MerR regulator